MSLAGNECGEDHKNTFSIAYDLWNEKATEKDKEEMTKLSKNLKKDLDNRYKK